MGAPWLWAKSDIRRRWRTLVALAVLGGLGGAFVLTVLIGARRASTGWERFRAETLDSDAFVSIPSRTDPEVADELERIPGVSAATSFAYVAVSPKGVPEGGAFAATDDRLGRTISRRRLLEGRRADPAKPDEITINGAMAAAANIHTGSRVILEGSNGFATQVTVVGVTIGATDLGVNVGLPGAFLTPAFLQAHGSEVDMGRVNQFVRLERGAAGVSDFRGAVAERYASDGGVLVGDTGEETSGVTDALRLQALAFALLAAAAAIATVLVVRQGLLRYAGAGTVDAPALGAVGMTLGQRVGALSYSVGIVALASTALAIVGAVCASPLVPRGLAATVEPNSGIKIDMVVLAGGGLLLAVAVGGAGLAASRRAMKLESKRQHLRPPLRLGARLGPTVTVGLGNALGGGGTRARAAARSAIAAMLVGSLAVTAAATFAASLDHLLGQTELYGWNFDALVGVVGEDPAQIESAAVDLAADPEVTGLAVADIQFASIGGENVEVQVLDQRKGARIGPTLAEGRAPVSPGEVVLGAKTMQRLRVSVGQQIEVAGVDAPVKLTVVGRGVFPVVGDGAMTDAAALSSSAVSGLRFEESRGLMLMVAVRDGTDPMAVVTRHTDLPTEHPAIPAEVKNLDLVRAAPWLLAAFLGLLGAAAVGHALVSSVRSGGRDLAVLRALGFVRRQVRATVLWQASAIVAIGLAV
ncbi:MAG TPA: hypothetical protein VF711_04640, partial [Acidimicrobiales bacterium]